MVESLTFTPVNIYLVIYTNSSIFILSDHKNFLQKAFGLFMWAAINYSLA